MTEKSIRRLSVSRRTLLSRAEANETPDGAGFGVGAACSVQLSISETPKINQ